MATTGILSLANMLSKSMRGKAPVASRALNLCAACSIHDGVQQEAMIRKRVYKKTLSTTYECGQ
jgi:hypothetical protein